MMDETDRMAQMYDTIIEGLRQLSMPAEKQLQKLRGTFVTDELADDFCTIAMPCACELLQSGWISKEQYKALSQIDARLRKMSEYKDKSIWDEKALYEAVEWAECRKWALDILEEMQAEPAQGNKRIQGR